MRHRALFRNQSPVSQSRPCFPPTFRFNDSSEPFPDTDNGDVTDLKNGRRNFIRPVTDGRGRPSPHFIDYLKISDSTNFIAPTTGQHGNDRKADSQESLCKNRARKRRSLVERKKCVTRPMTRRPRSIPMTLPAGFRRLEFPLPQRPELPRRLFFFI